MGLALSDNPKRTILTFRWIQILIITILISVGREGVSLGSPGYSLALFFFLTNIILLMLPREYFEKPWLTMAIFLLDVSFISLAIFLSGGVSTDFFIIYLLTIFMAAIGHDFKGSLFIAAIAGGVYAWIGFEKGLLFYETNFLIRISFLFLIAFFTGFLAQQARIQKHEKENIEKIQRDLQLRLEKANKSEELANEKILAMYEFNENLLESMEQGVMVVDLSGKIVIFNRYAEKLTGFKTQDMCGTSLNEKKGFVLLNQYLTKVKEDKVKIESETIEVSTAAQEVIPLEISISLLKYPQGVKTGMIILFREHDDSRKGNGKGVEGEMKKILVVDDESQIRLLYHELLSGGYQVFTASDGHTALRRIHKDKPDLVILDIKLPGVNGVEILQQLGNKIKDLPFIVCSGVKNISEDPDVKMSNVKAFLTKPVDGDELRKKVDQILQ
jgi:two-component system response regulator (stage 0 sporulation protein F)